MKATINFSDGSILSIKENDLITPIMPVTHEGTPSASIGKPVETYFHIHNGFIPALMEAFCHCDYFYLNDDYSVAYCAKAIVSIKTDL